MSQTTVPPNHPLETTRLRRVPQLSFSLSTMRGLILIVAVGGLLGCTPGNHSIATAEQVLSEHVDAIRLGDTNALVARYSPEFFLQPKRSRERLLASMVRVHESGAPEFTIVHREVRHDANGVIVSFSCQSRYGTRSFQEDFELYRAAGTTNFVILRNDFD